MRKLKTGIALLGLLAMAGAARADLIDRGNGMVYDTVHNITWMTDFNYAHTSGYVADGVFDTGHMRWDAAVTWAANLVYGGHDDWRLPTVSAADTSCSETYDPGFGNPLQHYGFNCTGSELSHMFVQDLGNKGGESVLNPTGDSAQQLANQALLHNVQSYFYWSGTPSQPNPQFAWLFDTSFGSQNTAGTGAAMFAVAVRDGDVAAVPEPQSVAMLLAGLGALAWVARRRSR